MDAVIQMHDLTKRFGGRPAVDRLTLTIPKGAIFALLGENGAGKTTTLRMLVGLLPADSGKAIVLGQDAWAHAVALRHRVAYVPEKPRYYDWMTVAELGWFSAGFQAKGFLPRFQEWTEKFLLDAASRLSTLSKGQYAKVGLAVALAQDPEILILDEPTSGLDLLVRREFLGSMIGLAAEGRTIVISSHQVAEVERIASHVAFLSHGKLLLTEPLDDLKRRLVRVRFQHNGTAPALDELGAVIERNGSGKLCQAIVRDLRREALDRWSAAGDIDELETSPVGLEEVYCALLARKEAAP